MSMTYTLKYSDWQWLIQPNAKKFLLKYKRPVQWTECSTFDTPEEAADAVAKGNTGQAEWDSIRHTSPIPSLASWLIDPTGGPFAPVVPLVSDLLRATLLPQDGERPASKE
jgi:hypothetical protein